MTSSAEQPAAVAEECSLAELQSDGAAAAGEWRLRVHTSKIIKYTYVYNGTQVNAQKLQVELLSTDPKLYCLGTARLLKKNEQELENVRKKFLVGTAWKFSKVALDKNEKACYMHTSVAAAIDLRKSTAVALLAGTTSFPSGPEPTQTVASVKKIRSAKRFFWAGTLHPLFHLSRAWSLVPSVVFGSVVLQV